MRCSCTTEPKAVREKVITWVIEFGQTPVDEPEFAVFVIYHHIVRLDVPVHDAQAVAVVERLQQLVQVEPDVVVRERLENKLQVS